jgi:hypothetical protein
VRRYRFEQHVSEVDEKAEGALNRRVGTSKFCCHGVPPSRQAYGGLAANKARSGLKVGICGS